MLNLKVIEAAMPLEDDARFPEQIARREHRDTGHAPPRGAVTDAAIAAALFKEAKTKK